MVIVENIMEGEMSLVQVLENKGLTTRQVEVANLMSQGLSSFEMGKKLFISEKAVKFHLTGIYRKLEVRSRAQAIVWCLPHMKFAEG